MRWPISTFTSTVHDPAARVLGTFVLPGVARIDASCSAADGAALLRLRDYGQKGVAVDHIEEVWKRAVAARRRAADAIERSAGLAEDHARRAEADGDHELAERERAHAKQAQEVVAEMRERDADQRLPS